MIEGKSRQDIFVADCVGRVVFKMIGSLGFNGHCPLGAFPDALRKATPSFSLTFENMINLFKGQSLGLWIEEINDWYE